MLGREGRDEGRKLSRERMMEKVGGSYRRSKPAGELSDKCPTEPEGNLIIVKDITPQERLTVRFWLMAETITVCNIAFLSCVGAVVGLDFPSSLRLIRSTFESCTQIAYRQREREIHCN
jgi:hypothetical protein